MEILIINNIYLMKQCGIFELFLNSKQFIFFAEHYIFDFFDLNSYLLNFELNSINYNIKMLKVIEFKINMPN